MPIRWSALKVSEAMDQAEHQVNLAMVFLAEAKSIAGRAKGIDNLPGYIDQELDRFIWEIERAIGGGSAEPAGRLKAAIEAVRKAIPDGAIEAERKRLRRGSQQSLI